MVRIVSVLCLMSMFIGISNAEEKVLESDFNSTVIHQTNTQKKIFTITIDAATSGVAQAQNQVGLYYEQGEGVDIDFDEAVYWYQLAANQGHLEAHYNLALMYANGTGVEQNGPQAYHLAKKSAILGYIPAQMYLARLYVSNENMRSESLVWLKSLAEKGDGLSQLMLAEFYLSEKEVDGYLIKAEYWLWNAVQQGVPEAQVLLEELYADKKKGGLSLDLSDLEQEQKTYGYE